MAEKGGIYERILGVRVDSRPEDKVLSEIELNLERFGRRSFSHALFIVTPNPEQIVRAQTDDVFAKVLNLADISLADGVGVIASYKFFKLPKNKNFLLRPFVYFAQGLGVAFSIIFDRPWLEKEIKVIRGREFFLKLIKIASQKNYRVFLLGDKKGSAQKAQKALEKEYKNLKIFSLSGPNLDNDANPLSSEDKEIEKKVLDKINEVKPHLLFVGFGAPKQEKWVYRWRKNIIAGVIMVVGGTFDYISGEKVLPPQWILDRGLEWLWRLLTGSQNFARIKVAIIDFPLRVFWKKLISD